MYFTFINYYFSFFLFTDHKSLQHEFSIPNNDGCNIDNRPGLVCLGLESTEWFQAAPLCNQVLKIAEMENKNRLYSSFMSNNLEATAS